MNHLCVVVQLVIKNVNIIIRYTAKLFNKIFTTTTHRHAPTDEQRGQTQTDIDEMIK